MNLSGNHHPSVNLTSDLDRGVHARSTAGIGLAMGAFTALAYLIDSQPWTSLLWIGYAGILAGLLTWQRRAARTVPRHATRISTLGTLASGGLMILAIVALHLLRADAELDGGSDLSTSPATLLIAGLGVAAPMLVSARLILRSERTGHAR